MIHRAPAICLVLYTALSVPLAASLQDKKHYSPYTYRKTEAQRGRDFSKGTYSLVNQNLGFLTALDLHAAAASHLGPNLIRSYLGLQESSLSFTPSGSPGYCPLRRDPSSLPCSSLLASSPSR